MNSLISSSPTGQEGVVAIQPGRASSAPYARAAGRGCRRHAGSNRHRPACNSGPARPARPGPAGPLRPLGISCSGRALSTQAAQGLCVDYALSAGCGAAAQGLLSGSGLMGWTRPAPGARRRFAPSKGSETFPSKSSESFWSSGSFQNALDLYHKALKIRPKPLGEALCGRRQACSPASFTKPPFLSQRGPAAAANHEPPVCLFRDTCCGCTRPASGTASGKPRQPGPVPSRRGTVWAGTDVWPVDPRAFRSVVTQPGAAKPRARSRRQRAEPAHHPCAPSPPDSGARLTRLRSQRGQRPAPADPVSMSPPHDTPPGVGGMGAAHRQGAWRSPADLSGHGGEGAQQRRGNPRCIKHRSAWGGGGAASLRVLWCWCGFD